MNKHWWKTRSVVIVVDNESWILKYIPELLDSLKNENINVDFYRSYNESVEADIAFLLGCTKIAPKSFLDKYKHSFVVHESDLPKGKGFAPMQWQILEGCSEIKCKLIEAVEEADSGNIYGETKIELNGKELNTELRQLQWKATLELCLNFCTSKEMPTGIEQKGSATFYRRRRPSDSELDINKSIADQFNLLRIVDNESYPGFFYYKGQKYKIAITKDI